MVDEDETQKRGPWWSYIVAWFIGGPLGLVAARMLSGQNPDQKDPDF